MNVCIYENPAAVGYRYSISAIDKSWHLFVDLDGKATLFN